MGDCHTSQGIRAEATNRVPRIKRMYYVVDMTTFRVQLYQTLTLVRKSFKQGLWGTDKDVYYPWLHRGIKEGESVLIANRFIVGWTEDVYLKCLKKDRRYVDSMAFSPPPHTSKKPILLY